MGKHAKHCSRSAQLGAQLRDIPDGGQIHLRRFRVRRADGSCPGLQPVGGLFGSQHLACEQPRISADEHFGREGLRVGAAPVTRRTMPIRPTHPGAGLRDREQRPVNESPSGRVTGGADRQHEQLIALRSQDVLEKVCHVLTVDGVPDGATTRMRMPGCPAAQGGRRLVAALRRVGPSRVVG